MLFRDMPIRKKLMRIILFISGLVLFVTSISFFAYEYYVFRRGTKGRFSTIGKIIAANSSAALAFHSPEDGKEILEALKTEPHVVAAALYDEHGNLFARYDPQKEDINFPAKPGDEGYRFFRAHLEGYEPVMQDARQLGTLYIKTDLGAMYARFRIFGIVALSVSLLAFLLAYVLSRLLQKSITRPILKLAGTAKIISAEKNYSVRAVKTGDDEVGLLTDSFNTMLGQIEEQNHTLKEFNQHLEKTVADRTEQLQAANKELESFSYSISHDLRAPLRIIDGYTDMLETDYIAQMDDEAKRIMGVIKSHAQRMGQLIDDLLNFARIGRKELVKNTVNMNEKVRSVLDELGEQGQGKAVVKIDTLDSVAGDSSLLRQVWINLIGNAIKYSGKTESPEIQISSVKSKDEIIYSVKDNGTGFDMKYADKLFGVFQRLHKASDFEGTGIGLALVKRIIARHEGRVWAESELGTGSTFYFSLPVLND